MAINTLSVVKFVAAGVVGVGTGKIVGKIIKAHVTPESIIDKVTITAAAWVIGGVATERTKAYTNAAVDEIAGVVTETVTRFKTDAKLGRINSGQSTFEKEGLDPAKFERNDNDDKWVRVKVADVEQTRDTEKTLEEIKKLLDEMAASIPSKTTDN